jgi:hypothetical protein
MPLPADLPRIEVIHELPEHELTCACGCRKHSIGSPQDPDVWIDQGAVDENDELRLLFVAKAPPGTFDNINP